MDAGADPRHPTDPGSGSLVLGADFEQPRLLAVGGGWGCVYSHTSPLKAPGGNEDGALVWVGGEHEGVLAIADGVGGHADGSGAARETLLALRRTLDDALRSERSLRDGILDGFEAADRAVLAMPGDGATTLLVAELGPRSVRLYHAGDSAALLTGQRGRLKHMTTPHSPVGYAVEAGVIDEAEAMVHKERHVVSNAVGGGDMSIEIGPELRRAARDTLILASDGLFDNLMVDEVIDLARKGPLEEAVSRLSLQARDRMVRPSDTAPGKPDDLTVVVWREASAGGTRPAPERDG